MDLSNSIQKHILREYIMKYSNLGTMNAPLSIRWSTAASKYDNFRMNTGMVDTVPLIIWLLQFVLMTNFCVFG
jgi:hypothetical protein